ncbi:MAG: tetratricopeptide repeat protein [Gammaproteobacteria bacterium]
MKVAGTTALWPACLVLAAVTLAVYWPGLHGDFLFDDVHAIAANPALDVTRLDREALLDAAFSTNTGPLRRPLALLSFAANRSLNGLSPFAFKLTNVLVHCLNAGLLMMVLMAVAPRLSRRPLAEMAPVVRLTALLWAVHPANLSSVLYVVQRMTLGAATCMLAAMLVYCRLRRRQVEGGRASALAWLGLAGLWLAGLGFKESAAVLPAYLLAIEVAAFRGAAWRRPHGWQWPGLGVLGLLVAAGAVLMLDRIADDYAGRAFTLGERLLTEGRVVLTYARMTLLPDPALFALFHDDLVVSRGLFDPPTTIVALLTLAVAAVVVARWRPPVVAFGLAWFLSGHLLESTVLPLELMHEHRNYLSSAGLLFVLLVGAEALARKHLRPAIAGLLALVLVAAPAAVTVLRATRWADPWTQMATEAHYHPNSSRSVYEFGRLSVERAGRTGDAELYRLGLAAVERAAGLNAPRPEIAYGSLLNQAVAVGDEARIERFTTALVADSRAWLRAEVLLSVLQCQVREECPPTPAPVMALADSVVESPGVPARLRASALEWLAVYYARLLGDGAAAIRILEEVVDEYPGSLEARARLAEVLQAYGHGDEAHAGAVAALATAPWHLRWSRRPLYRRLRDVRDATAASVVAD